MELNFDIIFKPMVLALILNRCHPSTVKDKKWLLECSIGHGLNTIIFILFLNSIRYDINRNDFSAACRSGCFCILHIVGITKYCIALLYQNKLIKIMNTIKDDYAKANNSLDYFEITAYYARRGSWVCKQWTISTVSGCCVFLIKNIVLYINRYYKKNDFELIPIFEFTYPDFIDENNVIIYLVTYCLILIYYVYSTITYIAFVPLGPVFTLHACGQLEIIKKRIENLFVRPSPEAEIKIELGNIIRDLQLIYSFVEDINGCFTVLYEVTLKAAAIMLPMAFFEVIEAFHAGEVSIEFLSFITGGILISASPCYHSDLLMEKGEQVRQAIYFCGWERQYDSSTRSRLLILLIRAVRPIALRTMFRTLCLETLTDLYQQSYGIFNLMNAMWH